MVSRGTCVVFLALTACGQTSEYSLTNGLNVAAEVPQANAASRLAFLHPVVSVPFAPEGMIFHPSGDYIYLGMGFGFCQGDSGTGDVTSVPSEVSEWLPAGSVVVDIGRNENEVLMVSGEFIGTPSLGHYLPGLKVARSGDDEIVALRGWGGRCKLTRIVGFAGRTDYEMPVALCDGDLAVDRRTDNLAWIANGDLWSVTTTETKVAENVGDQLEFEPTEKLAVVASGSTLRAFRSDGTEAWAFDDGYELVQFVSGGDAGLILAAYSSGSTDRLIAIEASSGAVMMDRQLDVIVDQLAVSQNGERVAIHSDHDVYIYALETLDVSDEHDMPRPWWL